jgi:hypothetical protein
MVKRASGLLVIIGLFSFAQSTRAQSWIEFQSKEGAFSILMPHQPARQSEPARTDAGPVDTIMYAAGTDTTSYVVIYSDFPFAPSSAEETNKRLDKGRDGGLARTKGKLVSESRIMLDGHLGREIKVRLDEGFLLVRIYAVNERVYQIIIAGTEAAIASPDAARFFNSFKLTGR